MELLYLVSQVTKFGKSKPRGGNAMGQQEKAKVIEMPRQEIRYLAVQDGQSGEFDALIRLNNKTGGRWFKVFQDALNWLSEQKITGEQYKVMLKLFAKLDFDNYIRVSQKEIAEELGMQNTHVSRAIRKLRELDIIFEAPRMGKYKLYRLNPHIGHKGKDTGKAVIEYDELRKRREQSGED